MNISAISKLLFLTGVVAATMAAAPGCGTEDEPVTGDEQDVSSNIDDAFAKVVLKGGCSVKLNKTGNTVKTSGKGGTCPTSLTGVLDTIAADSKNTMHTYVVSEQGDQPGANTPYRFVIAVETSVGGAEKLFLSTLGSGAGVSDEFVEVMSFNTKKGVYAFYNLEDGKWVQEGDGTQVATDTEASAAKFRCLGCHTNGQPLMKELHDSWGNWFSTWFTPPDPKSNQELFKRLFGSKERADDLEVHIIAGTKAFTKTRVDKAVKEGNLKPMLRQLMCDVGEPSIIGAHSANSKRLGDVSTFSSMVPTSILINNLFKNPRTGTGSQLGLDGVLELNLPALSSVRVDSASYVKAVKTIGQKIGGQAGDAIFPMSSPEKSFADIQVVQELVSRGLLDKEIIADALMTDFTVSTFSDTRCALADSIPKTWTTPEELRTKWAEALGSSSERGAAGLKARLDTTGDIAAHETALNGFLTACNARGTADKDAYALDLLKIISQRRVEFTEHYEQVVESNWLIPTDTLGSTPHAIRLNGTTCTIEQQSEPFVGEEG